MTAFIKTMLKNLISADYRFAGLSSGGDIVDDNTAFAVCIKAVPPVLYNVSLINSNNISAEAFEKHIADFTEKLRKNKESFNCLYLVNVNIIAAEKLTENISEFIDSKDYDPNEHDHNIWWMADISEKEIIYGKNMPSDIAGLRKMAESSFNGSCTGSVSAMEEEMRIKRDKERLTHKHTAVWAMIAVTVCAYIIIQFLGGDIVWAYILGNDHTRIALYGEYYRLITCMFVHAGYAHLVFNCVSLYIFGTKAEEFLGHIGFLLLYFGAGISGSLMSFAFTDSLSVGASGAVYGTLGAVLALTVMLKRSIDGLNNIAMAVFIIGGIGIGAMMGNVDNFAHIGGLIFGVIFTAFYYKAVKSKN